MREILFRGKMEDGKWHFGDLTQFKSGFVYIQAKEEGESNYVIPETVGQFTGLTDINGKKVFEGDIVDSGWILGKKGVVKYGKFNCSCCDGVYGWYIDGGDIRDLEEPSYLEVIGNIHDNPELVEVV